MLSFVNYLVMGNRCNCQITEIENMIIPLLAIEVRSFQNDITYDDMKENLKVHKSRQDRRNVRDTGTLYSTAHLRR